MSLINPDWIDPIESTFDEGKPIRQEQGLMFAGNVIAALAGKPGAPKVADKVVTGSGTTTLSGIDDFGGLFLRGRGTATNLSGPAIAELSVEYSADGGSSFSAAQVIASQLVLSGGGDPSSASIYVEVFIDFASANCRGFHFGFSADSVGEVSETITGMTNGITDIRFSGLDALIINPQGGDTVT